MKWNVLLNDPQIAQLIGLKAAKKAGMAEEIQELIQMRTQGLENPMSQTQMNRAAGEITSPEGFNMSDMAISQRMQRGAPENYTRG